MRQRRHLVVFLRAPRLGRVKSRLAAGIGALEALRFYRETCEHLLRRMMRDRRWQVHLALTPDRDALGARAWPVAAARFGQGMGDLGRRMERAVRRLPPGPVVIVGSDIPALGPAHVARAFAALGTHHAVFGPAADGGYSLADTLAGLPRDLRVAFLETLEDVDDAAAYARWKRFSRRPRASDAPGGAA